MSREFLPYGQHEIDEDDIAAVVDVLRRGPLTSGPEAGLFEKAFAEKVGAREAVVSANGTTALHLAVLAAGLGAGDIAIVPAITFLSTANVARMAGADVVFADVCPDTGLMTPDSFKAALHKAGDRAKVVLPVHLNGQVLDIQAIGEIAASKGITVVTDCCHALGAAYTGGGRPGDGNHEQTGCFSLHPVKSIAMGEGGVTTTDDPTLARQMRELRSHGMLREPARWRNADMGFDANGAANPWYYEMQELGYNYRATDFQCALGRSQLAKLERFVARRAQIADRYDSLLAGLAPLLKVVPRTAFGLSAWHLYPILIDFEALEIGRGDVMRGLQALGIGTQVHYVPLPCQPYYRDQCGDRVLPGAMGYYDRVLSLPIFPKMTDADVDRVVAGLEQVLSV